MVGLRLKILREGHKERRKDERLSYRIAIIGDVIMVAIEIKKV